MNFRLFLRIFLVFCLLFGIINLVVGGAALYGYFRVQKALSGTSLELSQSISTAKALFANVTTLASTSSSDIGRSSQNITALITGLENRIAVSKQDFYNESSYFSGFSFPDSSQQQSAGVAASFKSIGDQLNVTQDQYLPMLQDAVSSTALKINGSVSNINSSIAKLNQSFSLVAGNAASEIGTASGLISVAMLGFAFYSFLEGIVFIMLGMFVMYLSKNLYGSKAKPSDEGDDGTPQTRARPKKATAETGQGKKAPRDGLIKGIKDSLGIED